MKMVCQQVGKAVLVSLAGVASADSCPEGWYYGLLDCWDGKTFKKNFGTLYFWHDAHEVGAEYAWKNTEIRTLGGPFCPVARLECKKGDDDGVYRLENAEGGKSYEHISDTVDLKDKVCRPEKNPNPGFSIPEKWYEANKDTDKDVDLYYASRGDLTLDGEPFVHLNFNPVKKTLRVETAPYWAPNWATKRKYSCGLEAEAPEIMNQPGIINQPAPINSNQPGPNSNSSGGNSGGNKSWWERNSKCVYYALAFTAIGLLVLLAVFLIFRRVSRESEDSSSSESLIRSSGGKY